MIYSPEICSGFFIWTVTADVILRSRCFRYDVEKGENPLKELYMRRAIELAKHGRGWTLSNPLVGAVIVKNGKIIGEGYHKKYGDLHAERNALANCNANPEGATMYVTLEPCCHHGKTPPCTDAIIENKIAEVIIGSRDPNPLVAGKGADILRSNNISVEEDFLKEECDEINEIFFHYIKTGKPYVVMKFAQTLDGKIATRTGESKWISCEESRKYVHALRGKYTGILAGIGTVLADDPMLNCRIEGAHQPVRIICDWNLKLPAESKIAKTAKKYKTIIAYGKAEKEKLEKLRSMNLECIEIDGNNGRVNLKKLMEYLAKSGISSILIEGGGEINDAALEAGIVNHIKAFISPKILGGRDSKTSVEGQGIARLSDATCLKQNGIERIGDDILLEYDVKDRLED